MIAEFYREIIEEILLKQQSKRVWNLQFKHLFGSAPERVFGYPCTRDMAIISDVNENNGCLDGDGADEEDRPVEDFSGQISVDDFKYEPEAEFEAL